VFGVVVSVRSTGIVGVDADGLRKRVGINDRTIDGGCECVGAPVIVIRHDLACAGESNSRTDMKTAGGVRHVWCIKHD
jgi:hypothetical protein